jgi:hypothetical protein
MAATATDQWIELLATEEDRARIEKHLEDLHLNVWVQHRDTLPPGVASHGADAVIISIPQPPRRAGVTFIEAKRSRVPASSFFQSTWHGLIRDAHAQGVPILVTVPAEYPALDAVFASGATEVIEGRVTAGALRSRLRALHARRLAAEASPQEMVRARKSERSKRVGGLLGPHAGTVHDPDSGRIDAKLVARFFGIPLRRLTGALGLAYGSVHKTPDAASLKPALQPLARIVEMLNELGGSRQDVKLWLNRPLPDLEGDSPLETILAGEAEAVETLLRNAREGIPG